MADSLLISTAVSAQFLLIFESIFLVNTPVPAPISTMCVAFVKSIGSIIARDNSFPLGTIAPVCLKFLKKCFTNCHMIILFSRLCIKLLRLSC